jgi:hypothetical protein
MTFSGLCQPFNGQTNRGSSWVDLSGNLLLGASHAPVDLNSWYEGHFCDRLLTKAGGTTSKDCAPIPLGVHKPKLMASASYFAMLIYAQSLTVGAQEQPGSAPCRRQVAPAWRTAALVLAGLWVLSALSLMVLP